MIYRIAAALFLIFSMQLFGQQSIDFEAFADPGQIRVDTENNNLLVVDGTTIYMVSLSDFKIKKKFGKSGEGPKEFKRSAHVTFNDKHLIVNSLARISFFDKSANYIIELNGKSQTLGPYLPLGSQYVSTSMDRKEKTLKYSLNIYDSKLNKIKTIGHFSRNEQPGKKINAIDWGFPKYRVYKGRIYCEELDNELWVFNSSGKQLARWDIHKRIPDYRQVPVSESYKSEFWHVLKLRVRQEYERVKKQLRFPTYFTVIRDFFIRDNFIYIISFVKKGNRSEIHQFDLDGTFVKTFFHPNIEKNPFQFYPIDIVKGKFYQLFDEDGEWKLIITQLD